MATGRFRAALFQFEARSPISLIRTNSISCPESAKCRRSRLTALGNPDFEKACICVPNAQHWRLRPPTGGRTGVDRDQCATLVQGKVLWLGLGPGINLAGVGHLCLLRRPVGRQCVCLSATPRSCTLCRVHDDLVGSLGRYLPAQRREAEMALGSLSSSRRPAVCRRPPVGHKPSFGDGGFRVGYSCNELVVSKPSPFSLRARACHLDVGERCS